MGDNSACEASGEKMNTREKWKQKIDFAFSIAGGFVGLGNVWRFPYLCYKNGGGAFLIPYVLFVIVGSLPVFLLEVTIGQYTNLGSALAMRMVPLMKGLGFAVNIINYHLNVYYAVILAWALRYFFASMSSELPWSTCGNEWNTQNCFVFGTNSTNVSSSLNVSMRVSSVREYWERGVLGKSPGIGEVGSIRWELLLCLLLTWIIIYFCIWKGIGWTSKVVYFTATFPILMLLVLLVRGLTLDGAMDGVRFYLKPDMTRLSDVQVWLDAATQVFYSYALCKGMLITMGSYNNYRYNSYRDCIALSVLNSGVSFVSGFAIFAILGFMAKEQGVDIKHVAESGPGLAFIAYPKALTLLPMPQFWGCLFFFMLFLLGLDSEFVGQETLMSAFVDLKPHWFKKKWSRELFLAFLSVTQFVVGLSMITNGGVYVLNIFDNYAAAGWSMLFISLCECAAVAWFFGINKYWRIVCDMVGFVPRIPWFKWCWAVLTPISTSVLLVMSLAYYKVPTYNRTYTYPPWAVGVCWLLAMSSILWIPGYAVYLFFFKTSGTYPERWMKVITSELPDPSACKHQDVETVSAPIFEQAPLYEDVVGMGSDNVLLGGVCGDSKL
nr:sodium- and chloride-dependent taurine transporter [Ciona intestinalis]XP_026694251.1 sodium- and chloride-dependent taurine transporter [Ciona intestinalis]XP_026694252.1 sodium- and chloride-dependent taurine transporter [Ciona intestinalis]XP_026694253.1 sodium- and chloride-dependent taurine transporter [Ciona intestinalis]|eukprot:XP_002127765.1 sodium- and chloride-dependent taurine transporter [Ciona intestinalis]